MNRSVASINARQWFKACERNELETVSVNEHHLPITILETLIALLTISGDKLTAIESDD
jgi:hypothetical protein